MMGLHLGLAISAIRWPNTQAELDAQMRARGLVHATSTSFNDDLIAWMRENRILVRNGYVGSRGPMHYVRPWVLLAERSMPFLDVSHDLLLRDTLLYFARHHHERRALEVLHGIESHTP